ncbi:MAG TPA: hypothetical protein ACQGQF_06955 [Xylella fastidiosa subsp. pauca]
MVTPGQRDRRVHHTSTFSCLRTCCSSAGFVAGYVRAARKT